MSLTTKEVDGLLLAYFKGRQHSEKTVGIEDVLSFDKGRQHQMFSLSLLKNIETKKQKQSSILRLYDGPRAAENAEYEYNILNKLGPTNIPVPKVFLLEKDSRYLGRPFIIMEKVPGEDLSGLYGDRALNDFSLEASIDSTQMIDQLACLLASVHRLDYESYGINFLKFRRWQADSLVDALDLPEVRGIFYQNPKTHELLDWLLTAREAEQVNPELVMLHFDFHPFNVMVRDSKVVALLDWADACTGNAALDVGWSNLLLYMRGAQELIESFVIAYKRYSGRKLGNLVFYEVLAGCRQLFDLLTLREGGAAELNKRPDVGISYNYEKEIALAARFIYERTGIDTAVI